MKINKNTSEIAKACTISDCAKSNQNEENEFVKSRQEIIKRRKASNIIANTRRNQKIINESAYNLLDSLNYFDLTYDEEKFDKFNKETDALERARISALTDKYMNKSFVARISVDGAKFAYLHVNGIRVEDKSYGENIMFEADVVAINENSVKIEYRNRVSADDFYNSKTLVEITRDEFDAVMSSACEHIDEINELSNTIASKTYQIEPEPLEFEIGPYDTLEAGY